MDTRQSLLSRLAKLDPDGELPAMLRELPDEDLHRTLANMEAFAADAELLGWNDLSDAAAEGQEVAHEVILAVFAAEDARAQAAKGLGRGDLGADAASTDHAPLGWARLCAAAEMAARLHADQAGKGTRPDDRPLRLATLVLEHGGDEDQACAALLMGAIEEYGAEHGAGILDRFGPRVAAIVRACTDADVQPKPPWRARKEAYLARLEHAEADVLTPTARPSHRRSGASGQADAYLCLWGGAGTGLQRRAACRSWRLIG